MERQVEIPVVYKGKKIYKSFFADSLVDTAIDQKSKQLTA
ncbi:GxxExxY protein [Spirosoma aureum]|nr:GxxExxY protein [Spirosoma aureum]